MSQQSGNSLASQHKHPLPESTEAPSEVLSETTDLHVLMEAILGDGVAPPDLADGTAVVLADIEPGVAALPARTAPWPPAKYSDDSVVSAALPDDGSDAWGFEIEGPQNGGERPSRDRLRGSISKPWIIVAGMLAAALITVSAISLRGEATQTTRRSSEALGLMLLRPPGEDSSAVRPREFSEAAIRSPASKSNEVRVIEAPRANERPSPATDDQTTPILVERRDVTAPLTWPIVMSSDTLAGVEDASEDGDTPAQLLHGGPADYPAALRTAGIGGSVEVRFTIASNGEVLDVRSTSGPPQLRSIAEAAVRQRRYQAARVGNRPVETQTSVQFYFDPAKNAPQ